ncbi:ATP-binding cassette domain-containing protein [Paucilactobacillus nenjiangensis]|uniref:ATP-binding cassette domain-containing protein n=1 Tax=Paucilactobacillus nenjiangensis TaxID=1296540 RepID=UPI0028D833E6|nr:ATP-binding cassette domain-containing protein [Paucilactobacillus nenjiangensis]
MGGEVIAKGTVDEIKHNPRSVIAPFLNQAEPVVTHQHFSNQIDSFSLHVTNKNNIKSVETNFLRNRLNVVTGLSGSGKTTLIFQSLLPSLKEDGRHDQDVSISGNAEFKKIVEIDSSQIGINVRSTVATYTNIMDLLRKNFAKLAEAKSQKFTASNFSYNNKQGACHECGGTGQINLDVQYLPDIAQECPVCHGLRFKPEILTVKWHEKNIAEYLEMTVDEAIKFKIDDEKIMKTLLVLKEMGLSYLKIGESTPNLSGGESQRLKLTTYISNTAKNYLFVFDEPTVGLHPLDIQNLIAVMDKLIAHGATSIVIEHDLDFIANTGHIIDMGPRGGRYGGEVGFFVKKY